jgi:hypothetical protein
MGVRENNAVSALEKNAEAPSNITKAVNSPIISAVIMTL